MTFFVTIITKYPWQRLASAIEYCLHRRRAIRHVIRYEQYRQKGIEKIRKGIALRRRVHFAARIIQRIFRWRLLHHKMSKATNTMRSR